MKILVLDDNEILRYEPADYFVNPHDYRTDDFTQTIDTREFIKLFFNKEWDEIWIDHDLGMGVKTGRDVTKEIYHYILGSKRKMKSSPIIRITSMNDYAAKMMVSDLLACHLSVIRFPISSLEPYGIVRGETIHPKQPNEYI